MKDIESTPATQRETGATSTACPSWCNDHTDYPATATQDATSRHRRVIDNWTSGGGSLYVVDINFFTDADSVPGDPDDMPFFTVPGSECMSPRDALRIADAIVHGYRLITEA